METHAKAPAGRAQVLVGLLFSMALVAVDSTIVATAIPSIVRDLGGFSLFPWVFSVFLLTQAGSTPVYGKLADLYGRRPVLLAGTALFLAGSALCGLAWNMVALIVFRAIQGVGAGAVQPITTTVAGDLYRIEERGRVQALLASVWGVAGISGPAIGGLLVQYASWRWIFYLNLPVGAVALLLVATRLREDVTRRRHHIDVAGAALLVGGTGLVILGLLAGGVDWAWWSLPSVAVLGGALVVLAAFVWQERRAPEPILPLWVFGRRLLVGMNLGGGATIGCLLLGLSSFLPTYAQAVLGASPVAAGFAVTATILGWSSSAAPASRLYLRIGFRDTAMLGASVCFVAGLLFARLPQTAPLAVVVAASYLMGCGLGMLSASTVVGVQSVVGWERRGVVTGAYMFSRVGGSALGVATFGGIANATLVAWLHHAPASLASQLPRSVDAASRALTAHRLGTAASAYVRHGLYLASHRVFWGLAVVALAGLATLAFTPRRFAPLQFPDDDQQANQGGEPQAGEAQAEAATRTTPTIP